MFDGHEAAGDGGKKLKTISKSSMKQVCNLYCSHTHPPIFFFFFLIIFASLKVINVQV